MITWNEFKESIVMYGFKDLSDNVVSYKFYDGDVPASVNITKSGMLSFSTTKPNEEFTLPISPTFWRKYYEYSINPDIEYNYK